MRQCRPAAKRTSVAFAMGICLGAFVLSGVASAEGVRTRETHCVARWRAVPTPSPDPRENYFNDVSAASGTDIWAVGTAGYPRTRALIAQWNGRRWRRVPAANVGRTTHALSAVSVVSEGQAWAVGSIGPEASARSLIERWNGRAWRVVRGPMSGLRIEELYDVAAVAPNDVWAVGGAYDGGDWHPLIEHWDGRSWKLLPNSQFKDDDFLTAISAPGADNVWAVGSRHANPLVAHWDGITWQRTEPRPSATESYLNAVSSSSATEAWTVGQLAAAPLVQHWDGTAWRDLPIPRAHWRAWYDQQVNSVLDGVAALSPNDVWVTGFRIEHWNGRNWEPGPKWGGNAIAALSSTNVWVVGSIGLRKKISTRVMHYSCR